MRGNQRGLFISSKWTLRHLRVGHLNQQKKLLQKLLQKLKQSAGFGLLEPGRGR
jgi:hypothetical protein